MLFAVAILFAGLVALSMPIVFALGLSGFLGLVLGNFSLQKLPSSLVAGSQSWVLLAIPTFVFAGNLMERCGMSYALVNLARVLVGWLRGGLGMSVILAEYFFSGISGSTIADVSAIGSMLTPPMLRAGYKPEHAVSLVASATAMGILVPPAIFMIVLGQITDTSVVEPWLKFSSRERVALGSPANMPPYTAAITCESMTSWASIFNALVMAVTTACRFTAALSRVCSSTVFNASVDRANAAWFLSTDGLLSRLDFREATAVPMAELVAGLRSKLSFIFQPYQKEELAVQLQVVEVR